MAWQDELQEASFRGVTFYYSNVTSTVGRRTVVHKYPGRDNAETEDLGREPAEFVIEAYVLGPNYMADRNKLIEALEKPGSGYLVHPYWGNKQVAVNGKVRIVESTSEGGMARFTIPVIEAGDRIANADVKVDTASVVDIAADASIAASRSAFQDLYDAVEVIEDAVNNANTAVQAAFTKIRTVKGSINAALNLVDDGLSAIATAVGLVNDVIDLPGDLYDLVSGVVNQIIASVSSIEDSVADLIALGQDDTLPYSDGATSQRYRSQILMSAWRELNSFDADGAEVLGTGSQSDIEDTNLTNIIRMVRLSALNETIRAMALIEFDSFDRAFSVLSELVDAVDELAASATDDDEYIKLVDLRAKFAFHIQSTAANLPRIVEITTTETKPALVLSMELYGTTDLTEDIIARNGLRNPAAIGGNSVLEVLSNE